MAANAFPAISVRWPGREQRRSSAVARSRTPDLSRYYSGHRPSLRVSDFTFHLDLLRPKLPAFPLESMVDTFSWVDDTAGLTATLTGFRPDREKPATLPISRGDLIRCRVRWGAHTYELWTMRAQPPQPEVDTGNVSVNLADDMAMLDNTPQDWFFRKTKRRPDGYTATEISIEVGKRCGLKIGHIFKTTKRFELVLRNHSGLAVLKKAWDEEKKPTGTAYVIRFVNGKLAIVPIQRNPLLYVLGAQITTALVTQKNSTKPLVTVIEGHAQLGNGKHSKKIRWTDYDRSAVKQFGMTKKVKHYGRLSSHAELRRRVRLDLAAGLRVNDAITVDAPGLPFVQRGDGAQLLLPREGYKGKYSFVYATRASHTVSAGQYTSEWDFVLTDPYLAEYRAQQKAKAARDAKRAKRTRNVK